VEHRDREALGNREKKRGGMGILRSHRRGSGICLGVMLVLGSAAGEGRGHTELSLDIERISGKLRNDPDRVDLLVRRGQLFRRDGHPLASMADLNRAGRLAPDRWDIVFERAMTMVSLGRDEQADWELTRCLKMHPSLAIGYAERGKIKARSGRKAAAVADLNEAIGIKPSVDWVLLRGRLQEEAGQLDAAAMEYRDAMQRLNEPVLIRLALVRVEVARKHFEAALAWIDPALEGASIKTEWYLRRGDVLTAAGRLAEARGDLDRALKAANDALLRRETAIHLVNRAKVLSAMGQRDGAIADLRRAEAAAPHYLPARGLLNELESESGEREQSHFVLRVK